MQKSKIEWCDMTWNPLTGCRHGCPYCYARDITKRFGGYTSGEGGFKLVYKPWEGDILVLDEPLYKVEKSGKSHVAPFPFGFTPTFHRYRFDEPQRVKKSQTVFVCSMADMFGEWVPDEWIHAVFEACKAAPQHRYLFLTKNPGRYSRLDLPQGENFWFGVSATKHDEAMFAFQNLVPWRGNYFLSAEPLLGEMNLRALQNWPRWIITGAMTGPGAKRNQPRREWVDAITKFADWVNEINPNVNVPVFMKESLLPIMGEGGMRRETPWGLSFRRF